MNEKTNDELVKKQQAEKINPPKGDAVTVGQQVEDVSPVKTKKTETDK